MATLYGGAALVVVGGDFNGERGEFVDAGLGTVQGDGALVLHCGGCGVAKYCSPQCQATHWEAGHKRECPGADAASSISTCVHCGDPSTMHCARCDYDACAYGWVLGVGMVCVLW